MLRGRLGFAFVWAACACALAAGVFLAWVALGAWLAARAPGASASTTAAFSIYARVILGKGLLPVVLLCVLGASALAPRGAAVGAGIRALACLGAALAASALACGWLLPLDLPTLPAVVYPSAANLLRSGLELAGGAAAAAWLTGVALAHAGRQDAMPAAAAATRSWPAWSATACGAALLLLVALGPNPSPPRSIERAAALEAERSAGAAPSAPLSEATLATGLDAAAETDPAQNGLPVVVLRTQLERPRSRSQAVLLHSEHRSVQTAYEGDRILHHPDAALVRIEADHVLVERDGVIERLPVGGSAAALMRLVETGEPTPETPEQRRFKAENARRIAERLEDAREGRGSKPRVDRGGLLAAGEPVPVYRDGQLEGLRLEEVEPGGFYERIGLREGDVVTAVNGAALDDAGALEWLGSVEPSGEVKVDVVHADGQADAIRLRVEELMGELYRLATEGTPES